MYMSIYIHVYVATEHIQTCCLEESHLETIIPPLTLNFIGNGCECHSTNIYIPSKTDLTNHLATIGCELFTVFKIIYQNIVHYGIWYEL